MLATHDRKSSCDLRSAVASALLGPVPLRTSDEHGARGDRYDGILLNYANPLTGGPTLPTFNCAIQMLRPGEKTSAHRHTSSALYHVFRGKGATTIGDTRFDWEEGDSFVAPLWQYHRHENTYGQPAILFVMNDQPLMEALGFYREEEQG